jgi:hypothetical protein
LWNVREYVIEMASICETFVRSFVKIRRLVRKWKGDRPVLRKFLGLFGLFPEERKVIKAGCLLTKRYTAFLDIICRLGFPIPAVYLLDKLRCVVQRNTTVAGLCINPLATEFSFKF